MKKLLLLALLLFPTSAFAQASTVTCNPALTETAVLSSFADNVPGGITPRNLRDYVCSQTAGSIPFTFGSVGGGSLLTMPSGISTLPTLSVIPPTTLSTPNPVESVEVVRTYGAAAVVAPTLYTATQFNPITNGAFATGIFSEILIGTNPTISTFGEAIRGTAQIGTGVTSASANALVGISFNGNTSAATGTYLNMIPVEGQVFQQIADQPQPASFSAAHIEASFLATNGTSGSPKMADVGFLVNPNSVGKFQAGFDCGANKINYACYEVHGSTTIGLDLSLGAYSFAAIAIPNNSYLLSTNNGGGTTNVIGLNTSNQVALGATTVIAGGLTASGNISISGLGIIQTSNNAGSLIYEIGNQSGSLPSIGNPGLALGWNFSGGNGEAEIWNVYTAAVGFNSFNFRQMTSGTSSVLIATLGQSGFAAASLVTSGDVGGTLGAVTTTNTSSFTISTGTGTVKMSSGNNANNTAWIKMYVGTSVFWVPGWATNSP